MRTLKLFALVGIFLSFLRPVPTESHGLDQLTGLYQNYVVIGAFKYHRNAIKFTNYATRSVHLNAKYEMNSNRGLYYVYVLNTADRDEAITEALRLRDQSEFKDTWVFSGPLGKQKGQSQDGYAGVDINPVTQSTITPVSTESAAEATTPVADPLATASVAPASTTSETQPVESEVDDGIEGKRFFFKLYRNTDSQAVEGEVDIIDQEKLKKVGSFKGNMNVKIAAPPGKSKNIAAVCEVFGYRKVQRDFNYDSPAGDGIETSPDGAVTVPFELMRLQKGDIAIMYNVYFFKDAAIMRPESRFEVNSLLEMLNENPKYKIRIHGHTNGKASGKIIYTDLASGNFFSLNNTQETVGSAKKLSQQRADVIKNFLISNGVSESRMQTKAWGGKRPIHDKHHTRAQENVRVEIEILED